MKALWSLFIERGFRKNAEDFVKWIFITLGGLSTFYQIIDYFTIVNVTGNLLVITLILPPLVSIFVIIIKTKLLFTKTFHLKDHYKITVDVDDYLDNADQYPRAHLVAGSNNEFNIDNAKEGTLQNELIAAFFENETKDADVNYKNIDGRCFDEEHKDRLYNRNELLQSIANKVKNHEEYNLKMLEEDVEDKRYFQFGSIISEKCLSMSIKKRKINKYKFVKFIKKITPIVKEKDLNETRRMLFFANSQYKGGEYKGDQSTLSSIDYIWNHFEENNIKAHSLLMPLLGTGLSNDATPMSSTIAIIDHFFELSYPENENSLIYKQLVPHLIISIRPQNIENGEIDLLAVHKHIEVMNARLDYAYRKDTIYRRLIDRID